MIFDHVFDEVIFDVLTFLIFFSMFWPFDVLIFDVPTPSRQTQEQKGQNVILCKNMLLFLLLLLLINNIKNNLQKWNSLRGRFVYLNCGTWYYICTSFFCLPFVENGRLKILLELPDFSESFQLFLSVPEFRRADRWWSSRTASSLGATAARRSRPPPGQRIGSEDRTVRSCL